MTARKVKKAFSDRYTGAAYQPGDLYTGTDERLAELESGGYLTKTDVPEGGEGEDTDDSTDRQPTDTRPTRKR